MLLYCCLSWLNEESVKSRDHGIGTRKAAAQCKPHKRETRKEETRGGSVTVQTRTPCRKGHSGGSQSRTALEAVLLKSSLKSVKALNNTEPVKKAYSRAQTGWWVVIKRSHVKSLAALDNGQEPHQPSCPRQAHNGGWQSLNTVVQRLQDWDSVVPPALPLPPWARNLGPHFLHLSNGTKNYLHRVMVRDKWYAIYTAPHSEPGTLFHST